MEGEDGLVQSLMSPHDHPRSPIHQRQDFTHCGHHIGSRVPSAAGQPNYVLVQMAMACDGRIFLVFYDLFPCAGQFSLSTVLCRKILAGWESAGSIEGCRGKSVWMSVSAALTIGSRVSFNLRRDRKLKYVQQRLSPGQSVAQGACVPIGIC